MKQTVKSMCGWVGALMRTNVALDPVIEGHHFTFKGLFQG